MQIGHSMNYLNMSHKQFFIKKKIDTVLTKLFTEKI